MTKKIPVYLINGTLGSGKTTLLAQLLPALQGRHFVIENEIANVSVDDKALDTPDIHVIAGECVCCSDGSSLLRALMHAHAQRFEGVCIESTGAASMANLLTNLLGEQFFADNFQLQQTILVVDALALARALPSPQDFAVADTVVVSKLDLVSPKIAKRVRHKLRALHNNVVTKDKLKFATLLQEKSHAAANLRRLIREGMPPASLLPTTAVVDLPQNLSVAQLAKNVSGLERAKGFVATPSGTVRFEATAEHYDVFSSPTINHHYIVLIDRDGTKVARVRRRIEEWHE